MKQIFNIVNENRKEAIDLVKKNGGRIDFVEGIIRNNPDDPDEDSWDGYIAEEEVPWVIMGLDSIVDTAVLGGIPVLPAVATPTTRSIFSLRNF